MTVSFFYYGDTSPDSDIPIEPAQSADRAVTLGDFKAIPDSIRAIGVSNDDGTTGIRFVVSTGNAVSDKASQTDRFLAANSYAVILVQRKARGSNNKIYISAVADT